MTDRVRWAITGVILAALIVALFVTPNINPFVVKYPW